MKLPTREEAKARVDEGGGSELDKFVYENEPYDFYSGGQFRNGLSDVLTEAIRTATEAALKYSYNELSEVREASDRGAFISRAYKALLGEGE